MKTKHLTNAVGIAGITALAISILVGCSVPTAHSDEPPKPFFEAHHQLLPDGRTVLCLYKQGYATGYAGPPVAMSCDWANIAPAR